ncbi:MAG TPA: prepilin-type N-terminal cleavage/methylation domain-containing protein [Gammaproteobacteria bacterium]|nr:prepilin-type N-terminal cleavage/methylation domain-containing protein [Gammaproteobacteria bacterium]
MLKKRVVGFSLAELIVVILLVGVLAVIAIPRFINQTSTAQQNSTNSLAAALSAASADNFAKRSANSASGSAIANCTNVSSLLPSSLPTGYTITSAAIANGATVTCTLSGLGGTTQTFVGLGIS